MNIRKLKPGQFVELECKYFVAEGLGLSYFADEAMKEQFKPHVFFIWGVLPGERFIARLAQVKSKVGYGILARLDELPAESQQVYAHSTWALHVVSADRAEPACANYLRCGGCRMQHMSYERSVEYKREWLLSQLARNKVAIPAMEFHGLPEEKRWHYRNHVQVHINKYGTYGFYEPVSYRTRAFPDHGCLIYSEKPLRDQFPKYPVEVRAARIRINTDNKAVFTILNAKDENDTLARYSIGWPKGRLIDIEFPVTAFFQANLRAIPDWLEKISEFMEKAGIRNPRVLELFSGFGFISRMQSLVHPMKVLAMDILSNAHVNRTTFFEDGKKIDDQFISTYYKTDLFLPEKISEECITAVSRFQPGLLIINPPRAGLLPATWKKLRETALKDFVGPIIYSSCDAATMARDLATFVEDGYSIQSLTAFDFFPWTHHYETVSLLSKQA